MNPVAPQSERRPLLPEGVEQPASQDVGPARDLDDAAEDRTEGHDQGDAAQGVAHTGDQHGRYLGQWDSAHQGQNECHSHQGDERMDLALDDEQEDRCDRAQAEQQEGGGGHEPSLWIGGAAPVVHSTGAFGAGQSDLSNRSDI